MITLEQARNNIGEEVIYRDKCAYDIDSNKQIGVITSVNDHYIFVRYEEDTHSKATMPEDINFSFTKIRLSVTNTD